MPRMIRDRFCKPAAQATVGLIPTRGSNFSHRWMTEWFMVAVLKTAVLKRHRGFESHCSCHLLTKQSSHCERNGGVVLMVTHGPCTTELRVRFSSPPFILNELQKIIATLLLSLNFTLCIIQYLHARVSLPPSKRHSVIGWQMRVRSSLRAPFSKDL